MWTFTKVELTVLHSIFEETPELASRLKDQLALASVRKRENTGNGFFTTINVPSEVPQLDCPTVLGHETFARVASFDRGLGFVLFMEDGKLHLLEGYAFGESTVQLSLEDVTPEVFRQPKNPKL